MWFPKTHHFHYQAVVVAAIAVSVKTLNNREHRDMMVAVLVEVEGYIAVSMLEMMAVEQLERFAENIANNFRKQHLIFKHFIFSYNRHTNLSHM